MNSFVSGPYFNLQHYSSLSAGIQNYPAGSAPVPAGGCRRRPQSRPGGQSARPRRRGQLPAPPAPATAMPQWAVFPSSPPAPAAASASSRRSCVRLLRCGSPSRRRRRDHIPRARQLSCSGPLLLSGRPCRWRPPRPRLPRHCSPICRFRNSTAGKLQKAYQMMHNAATWKMNRYLCRAKIGERWESLDPILVQIWKMAKPGNDTRNVQTVQVSPGMSGVTWNARVSG